LENYLESVAALPGELKRNFQLMRELDTRTQENLEEIEQLQRLYAMAVRKSKNHEEDEAASLVERVRSQFQECIDTADEKVSVAVQTYELVDKHIRRLDGDLKKFESELEHISAITPPATPVLPAEPAPAVLGRKGRVLPSQKRDDKRRSTEPPAMSPAGKRAADARVLQVDLDMPIDPNEPTYCICNRVSFGEMVGCDNPECTTEWFHFECVGLQAPPKGKWSCANCSAAMKNKLKRT